LKFLREERLRAVEWKIDNIPKDERKRMRNNFEEARSKVEETPFEQYKRRVQESLATEKRYWMANLIETLRGKERAG
jgi:hypothetical protein